MPEFYYVARDRGGKKNSGIEEAQTKEEVIGRLQAKDLIVVNIFSEQENIDKTGFYQEGKIKFKPRHNRVTSSDLALFCRQVSTLLGSGVTIIKSLNIISQQVSSRQLHKVAEALQKDMEGGLSFHEAMGKHPKVFSDLWVNLVESGEASGNLAVILTRLANYLEQVESFKKKMISAVIYPAILMVGGLGALLFLTVKIIPTFAEIFEGFNIELPLLTRFLLLVSFVIRKFSLFIIFGTIAAVYLIKKYIKTKNGRRQLENLLFRLPVFGEFFHAVVIERFSSEMATLVESGVPILYSLEITERSVDNLIVADIIHRMKEDVRAGKPLSQQLEKSGFFEPMVVQMVGIGEEIGELSQMFKKINDFYLEYVSTFLTRFTSMFEPIILVVMGVAIGIVVVGMFLPIFEIAKFGAK